LHFCIFCIFVLSFISTCGQAHPRSPSAICPAVYDTYYSGSYRAPGVCFSRHPRKSPLCFFLAGWFDRIFPKPPGAASSKLAPVALGCMQLLVLDEWR
jgi:hypothetical protein